MEVDAFYKSWQKFGMDSRKQVQLDPLYSREIEKLRELYRRKKRNPPSVPVLVNKAIAFGFGTLRAAVAQELKM